MPVAAALGETLVGLDNNDVADSSGEEIRAFVAESEPDPDFAVNVDGSVTIGPAELANARDVKSATIPYQGIGIRKPLTIVLEKIYLGEYPDAMPWFPISRGDVLVTSAHKGFEWFDAAPQAVHLLERDAERRASLKAKATQQGSQLVYYSPAVTELSILFSVELSVDRDFNKEVGDALAKAVTAAGALPGLRHSGALPCCRGSCDSPCHQSRELARTAAGVLRRTRRTELQPSWRRARSAGRARLVRRQGRPGVRGIHARSWVRTAGCRRRLLPGRTAVRGDEPRRDRAAGTGRLGRDGRIQAAIIERFFTSGELATKALEIVSESLVLYNDMTYQRKAADALRDIKAEKDPAKKMQKQEQVKAYLKNIKTKELRDTVEADSA